MDAFLTPAELFVLTGYVKPSKQIERLRARGIPIAEINRFGRPVVLRDWRKPVTSTPEMGPVR